MDLTRPSSFGLILGSWCLIAGIACAHGSTFQPIPSPAPMGGGSGPSHNPTGGGTPGGGGVGTGSGGSGGGRATAGGGNGGRMPTPGSRRPQGPGGRGQNPGRRKKPAGGLTWRDWWNLNQSRFLAAKSFERTQANASRNVDTFLDLGDQSEGPAQTLPRSFVRRAVIPILLDLVKHDYYDVRASACIAIGKSAGPSHSDAFQALRTCTLDDDLRIAEAALIAIGLSGAPAAQAWLCEVAHGTYSRGESKKAPMRLQIAASIGLGLWMQAQPTADTKNVVNALTTLIGLKSRNPALGVAAMLGLSLHPHPSPKLVAFTRSVVKNQTLSAHLRGHAAVTLGKWNAPATEAFLLKDALGERLSLVRQGAIIGLGLVGSDSGSETLDRLRQIANSAAQQVERKLAVLSLGEIGGSKAEAELRDVLSSKNRSLRPFAALALGVAGAKPKTLDTESASALLTQLKELPENSPEASTVALALGISDIQRAATALRITAKTTGSSNALEFRAVATGLLGDRPSAAGLEKLLVERKEVDLRLQAALGLGLIGNASTIPFLLNLLSHEKGSDALNGAVSVAIGRIGGRGAADGLAALAKDSKLSNLSKAFVAVALGYVGDKRAIPGLAALHAHTLITAIPSELTAVFQLL